MEADGRRYGQVLDLCVVGLPYQVHRQEPIDVQNPLESSLLGHETIAGYPKELWELPYDQLPPSARFGKVVGGFYQVFTEHVYLMSQLNTYLTDKAGRPWAFPETPLPENPRRRVVLLIERMEPSEPRPRPDGPTTPAEFVIPRAEVATKLASSVEASIDPPLWIKLYGDPNRFRSVRESRVDPAPPQQFGGEANGFRVPREGYTLTAPRVM